MAEHVVALSAWLDPHLLYRLLRSLPSSPDLVQAQAKVLAATRLVSELEAVQKPAEGQIAWYDSRTQTEDRIRTLQADRSAGNIDKAALRLLAKLLYETGDYAQSLTVLRELSKQGETDLWGLLHAAIASGKLEDAIKYAQELNTSTLTSEQRIWLVHLTLFLAYPEKPSLLLDMSGAETAGLAIACPHLVKYLLAAYLLALDHKGLAGFLAATQSHPQTEPLAAIVNLTIQVFDFKGAMQLVPSAMETIRSDFFLGAAAEQLGTNIQRFIIETYLRIHSRLSMQELSSYLGFSVEQTEQWAANLIRNARMEAAIEDGNIKIQRGTQSLYAGIIEKTKEAYFRSKVLLSNIKAA